jgi:hypothetical protein
MLAAELVGPNGTVVGIDRCADVLAVARQRAQAAGHANIEFRESAAEDFVDQAPFDLAIGRYVLIHQGNPAAFIRSAASLRRGGVIAFHEVGISGECQALPPVPLWQQTWSWARAGLRSVVVYSPENISNVANLHATKAAATSLGVELTAAGVRDAADIERDIDAFAGRSLGGLIVLASPITNFHRELIIALVARDRLSAVYP